MTQRRRAIRPPAPSSLVHVDVIEATFNFAATLAGHASSPHTHRAYYRWIDRFLVDLGGLNAATGRARTMRMAALPVPILQRTLSAPQFRAWLGRLTAEGHGKQGLMQAHAAIVTLALLLSEAELIDDYTSFSLRNVRIPRAESGQRQGRWLSTGQLRLLITSAREIATSDNQALRNHVMTSILCTMALRREELAVARWGDLSLQNDRVVLRVHGKGRKMATIDVPRPVLRLLNEWRRIVEPQAEAPAPETPLVRRIWKGGRVSKGPLTPDGIWLIVTESARRARLGHVAPHDLRRSVAGALHESGTPIEKISQLLRHSSVAVTERYLSRLPRANEGAILMSDLLGLEPDGQPDWTG